MKKITYYRACKTRNRFYFTPAEGYLITFYNGFGAVDVAIGKNNYNLWTITEITTGFLFHNDTFTTRKKAIEAITAEYLKKAIEKMNDWQWLQEARDRLSAYRAEKEI